MSKTKFIKISVEEIENNKWYIRDCDNNIYDLFYCVKIEDKTISGFGIINNEVDNDLTFEKCYFKSDFFIIKEVPDREEEMREMLERVIKFCDTVQSPGTPALHLKNDIEQLLNK